MPVNSRRTTGNLEAEVPVERDGRRVVRVDVEHGPSQACVGEMLVGRPV